MRASSTVSRISISLLIIAGLCLSPGLSRVAAAPTMQWDGDQTVTGNQTVSGGVNVGSSSDAATGQVKLKSTTASPNVAWHSYNSSLSSTSAGFNLGTSVEDPTGHWSNDANVLSESSAYAYTTYMDDFLKVYGFGFYPLVPSNATITGVEVSYRIQGQELAMGPTPENEYKALCQSGGATVSFQLLNDQRSGTGTPKTAYTNSDGSWTVGTLGSSSDLWGVYSGLTRGNIVDPDFGVQVALDAGGYVNVDYVKIKVYYTATVPAEGKWMIGSFFTDASWRLAQSLTSFASPSVTIKTDGKVGIGTTAPAYRLEVNGDINAIGSVRSNGTVLTSSRDFKMGITPVPAVGTFSLPIGGGEKAGEPALRTRTGAWDLLDNCNVVDYEYKRIGLRYRLFDGREVDSLDGLTSTVTRLVDGNTFTEEVSGEALVADEFPVWLEEGSGNVHRGFIAEEVPAEFTEDGKSVMISDITANNTAALKEAKRRILELEKQVAALAPKVVSGQLAGSAGAPAVGAAGSGASGVSDLSDASDLSDKTFQRLTESVLKKLGVEPWVEITAAEAWEEVDETAPVSSVETVTRYRFNSDIRLAEAYTTQETVTRQAPTGRKIVQLKRDARLDEKTGKFYRWCGLGGAAANGMANS